MYENEIYSGSGSDRKEEIAGTYSAAQAETGSPQNFRSEQTYRQYQDYSVGEEPKQQKKKEKKSSGLLKKGLIYACCGLCFGLFAGLGFYAVEQVTGISDRQAVQEEQLQTSGTGVSAVGSEESQSSINLSSTATRVVTSDVSDMVAEVMPAMVSIVNNYTETATYWGRTYSQEGQASGSGIIIGQNDTELLIATNYHVVSAATSLEVTFIDDSVANAQIKGEDSDMDLAVIAVNIEDLSEETKANITIAKLGDSDALKLGEPVVAIGNALGYGQSVTGGYVSALNREITMENGSTGTFIQTDAAINPGNSGGALLNMNGEVIGINSSKIGGTTVEGMGYAIPISAAQPIIEELMLKETRVKITDGNVGYLGVNLATVTNDFAAMYNVPQGVFIRSVEAGSPAEEAGILSGDVMTAFDGNKITIYEDLQEILQYYGPGSTATVTVMRQIDGQYVEKELEITLGTNPNK